MIVSVICPCRNEIGYVDAFLCALGYQQTHGFELEVIVADGESNDGTASVLKASSARDKRIKVISNPNRVVSTGLNNAIKLASGEIIVRMDVHTEYADDYVAQCVRQLQKTGATCVGGPWLAKGNSPRQKAIAAAFGSVFGSGWAKSRLSDYAGLVDTVYLGAWKRDDLIALGGFDEELARNQDDELCLRIARSGGKVWQSPTIKSHYIPRDTLLALWRQFYQYGYWKAAIVKKHRVAPSLRALVPPLLCLALAILSAVALVVPQAGIAAVALILAYVAIALFAAIRAADRLGGVALIVFSYMCMHFGYGIGLCHGVLDLILLQRKANLRMLETSR